MRLQVNSQKASNLFLVFLAMLYLGTLPYFNLVLKIKVVGAIFLTAVIFLSSLPGKFFIKISIFLLAAALILYLKRQYSFAETTGELIWMLLALGITKELFYFCKETANEKKK